jgi:hypothetical protein
MAANVQLEKTAAGKWFLYRGGVKNGKELSNGELKGLLNMYKKVPVRQIGGKPEVWVWTGTGRRAGPQREPAVRNSVASNALNTNNEENTKSAPYIPTNQRAQQLFTKIRNNWGLKTNGYLQKWLGTQSLRIGASPENIMESIVKHSAVLNKNIIKTAFTRLRNKTALYTAAPTGNRSAEARVNEYLRNVALDELTRKFTPSLRQAHSGSLFEQAAIAIAANAAGKKVLSFPKTGNANTNNFKPNENKRKYYEGNRLSQIWSAGLSGNRKKDLENGIFVLKSAFGLGRIKTNETINKFKKLFYNLVMENAANTPAKRAQQSYNSPAGGLLSLFGKNANTSLWKGFYEVQPDVLYFVLKGTTLYVYIYEFKIGSGHAQRVPAEYFQLVKAKRTLELIFQKHPLPPGYNYNITIHFFPLKYRLVGGPNAPTDFAHPTNSYIDKKWQDYYREISKDIYAVHGSYAIKKTTSAEKFEETTGVSIAVVKKVLDAYSMSEEERIRRAIRHRRRTGAYASVNASGAAAATAARAARPVNNNVNAALASFEVVARPGPNYIANVMAQGIRTLPELIAALNYLDIAGYKLKKRGNSAVNLKSIVLTLEIPSLGPLNNRGSTWSGVKKPKTSTEYKATIDTLLKRIEAARIARNTSKLDKFGKIILAELDEYEFVPPPANYLGNAAQNARANMRERANNVVRVPEQNFDRIYQGFLSAHVKLNKGITRNNARAAVVNALESEARRANARGNENVAELYRLRKNRILNA